MLSMVLAPVLLMTAALQSPPAVSPEPAPTTELRHDAGGRPVIGARLNGRGPFDMVLDTAAQTSLLTPALAQELALKPLEQTMTIAGAVGGVEASVYPVEHYATDLFTADYVGMLALPNASTTSARGIVGMERFTDAKLVIDKTSARVSVEPSAPAPAGYATIKGQTQNGLLSVPLVVNGVAIQALVDSGAGVTVANLKVLEALGWALDDPRLQAAGTVRGAAMTESQARIGKVDTLKLGPISFGQVPMIFTDTGDDAEPRIILGSNLLNLLEAYAIDFPRAELQIRLPPRPAGH